MSVTVEEVARDIVKLLRPTKPMIVFDLEGTGPDPRKDKIVEISATKVWPDGTVKTWHTLVNPERPIPAEATETHHIHDEDVSQAPPFRTFARSIAEKWAGCILVGYNIRKYDIPLLCRELVDAGEAAASADIEECEQICAFRLWQHLEPRSLADASERWAGKKQEGLHRAGQDVLTTTEVLRGQLLFGTNNQLSADDLIALLTPPDPARVDPGRRLLRDEQGVVSFRVGKWKEKPLGSVPRDYIRWVAYDSDFPEGTKRVLRRFLDGEEI